MMWLCRSFTRRLEESIRKRGLLDPGNPDLPRLHPTFISSTSVALG